jgi:uncharacterized protein (DUF58 family)
MAVSSFRRSKYATAIHIAGGVAFACLDRVSPVGVVSVGGRELRVEPSLGAGPIMQWLHRLRRFRYDEPTTIGRRITQLAPTLTSRALVVTLSDLHDPTAVPALKLLAQKHDCVVIQLQDPAELGLRGAGFLRAGEAETGQVFVSRGKRLGLDPSATAQELKRAGVDHLLIRTDQPFAGKLRHFFKSRHLLGRGAR